MAKNINALDAEERSAFAVGIREIVPDWTYWGNGDNTTTATGTWTNERAIWHLELNFQTHRVVIRSSTGDDKFTIFEADLAHIEKILRLIGALE